LAAKKHAVIVGVRAGSFAEKEARRLGLPTVTAIAAGGLRRLIRQYDFDVINAHTGRTHVSSVLASLGLGTAVVRTRGDARSLSSGIGQSVIIKRTNAVIGASKSITEEYRKAYPKLASKFFTVYPGVPSGRLAPEPEGPLRLGVLGRLDPVKGHGYVIEAAALLKDRLTDEKFVIAGEEKKRHPRRTAQESGGGGRVEIFRVRRSAQGRAGVDVGLPCRDHFFRR
jgi:glycosyltransferase involved in cell wall biosynthesis